jgi:phospholipase/lecithinase/hemolysin
MKQTLARKSILQGLLALLVALPLAAAAQSSFTRIVAFGDSLSDPGNAFALVGQTNTPPDWSVDPFLVPDRPYARGGQHFSDGATWVEQLGRALRLAASVQAAARSPATATNYAIGGARARETGRGIDLPVQVRAFITLDFAGRVPSDALYVVAIGGNDLRDALTVAGRGADPTPILNDAIRSIASHIQQLHAAGARSFLVWNAPDLGLTPAIRGIDALRPGTAAGATGLSQTFNFFLGQALDELGPLPGISIRRLDIFSKLNEIVNQPAGFGLTNVKSACITFSAPFACTNPDEYLFWDGIHPTGAGHAIIAHEAASILAR